MAMRQASPDPSNAPSSPGTLIGEDVLKEKGRPLPFESQSSFTALAQGPGGMTGQASTMRGEAQRLKANQRSREFKQNLQSPIGDERTRDIVHCLEAFLRWGVALMDKKESRSRLGVLPYTEPSMSRIQDMGNPGNPPRGGKEVRQLTESDALEKKGEDVDDPGDPPSGEKEARELTKDDTLRKKKGGEGAVKKRPDRSTSVGKALDPSRQPVKGPRLRIKSMQRGKRPMPLDPAVVGEEGVGEQGVTNMRKKRCIVTLKVGPPRGELGSQGSRSGHTGFQEGFGK